MRKQILTADHELWEEFVYRMGDTDYYCDHTTRNARAILEDLANIAPVDIQGTLDWFESQGGYCDCEIILNCCLE